MRCLTQKTIHFPGVAGLSQILYVFLSKVDSFFSFLENGRATQAQEACGAFQRASEAEAGSSSA